MVFVELFQYVLRNPAANVTVNTEHAAANLRRLICRRSTIRLRAATCHVTIYGNGVQPMVWQPLGHMPGFHAPGTTVPIPYILEQQALAAQAYAAAARAQEEAARAHAESLEAAARRFEATGATCDVQTQHIGAADARCGRPGAGRCGHCERVFCREHRSASPASADLCDDCQVRQRQEAAAAEEARHRAHREEVERLEREHSQRVAQREARLGWTSAQKRIAWLDGRIVRYQRAAPTSGAAVFGAVLSFVAVPIFAVVAISGQSANDTRSRLLGGAGTLLFLAFTPRAIRTLWNGHRHKLYMAYDDERRELLTRRGCGVQGCPRCQLDRKPASRTSQDGAGTPVRAAALRNATALGVVFVAATAGGRLLWAIHAPNTSGATGVVELISGLLYVVFAVVLPVASGVFAARTVTRLSLVARRAQVVSKINLQAAFDWKSIWASIIMTGIAGYLGWAPAIASP